MTNIMECAYCGQIMDYDPASFKKGKTGEAYCTNPDCVKEEEGETNE